jgi:hypothetical protein
MLAGNTCSHSCTLALIGGEFVSMPAACGSKISLPRSSVGSGQFGTSLERMQRENFVMSVWICWSTAGDGATPGPPSGSRCPHALAAAGYLGFVVAPSSWGFGHDPLLLGSGKFGTPLERMQWEKASSWAFTDWVFVDPPPFGEPPEAVDDGPPPHAATTRTRTAVAVMAATVRALAGHARSGRRVKRGCASSFPPRDWMLVPAAGPGVRPGPGVALGLCGSPRRIRDRVRRHGPSPTAGTTRSMGIHFMEAVLRPST